MLFCGCGLDFFSPLRGSNPKTTHNAIISHHIFQLNSLKDTTKAVTMDLLMLSTLLGTKITFLTPKR